MRTRSLVASLLLVVALAGRAAAQPADDQAHDVPVVGVAGIEAAIATCVNGAPVKCREAAAEMERLHLDSRYGFTPGALRARADELLDKACTAGDGSACYEQGRHAERRHRGSGASPGRSLIEKACLLRYGDACAYLGDHEKRARAAVALYEQACAGRSAHGCEQLALRLGARDRERALALHHDACLGDDLGGCEHSGELRRARGDRDVALADFGRACDLAIAAELHGDDVTSCDAAGELEPDQVKALALFERACAAGHPLGCQHQGERVARGEGDERNWGRGLSLIAEGCELARDSRCRRLTELRRHPPDWSCATPGECEARCTEQLWPACRRLVELDPYGARADALDARAQEAACDSGDAPACRLRGDVSGTFADALPWYQRGCKLGEAISCRYVQLSRALRAPREAAALARACAQDGEACALHGLAIASRDPKRAMKVWRAACDARVGLACRFLADLLDPDGATGEDAVFQLVLQRPVGSYGVCGCPSEESSVDEAQMEEARRLLLLGCAAGDRHSCGSAPREGESDAIWSRPPATLPAWE